VSTKIAALCVKASHVNQKKILKISLLFLQLRKLCTASSTVTTKLNGLIEYPLQTKYFPAGKVALFTTAGRQ
jgi:hypothetical protein